MLWFFSRSLKCSVCCAMLSCSSLCAFIRRLAGLSIACTESQLWQGTDSCKCEQEYQISHTSTRHLLSKGFIQLQATPDPVITSLILKVCNSLWFTSYLAFKPRCDSTFAQTESLSESQSLSLGCKSRANQILVLTQLRWITVRGEQNNSWTPQAQVTGQGENQ